MNNAAIEAAAKAMYELDRTMNHPTYDAWDDLKKHNGTNFEGKAEFIWRERARIAIEAINMTLPCPSK
jgi:hypothetical protein